MANYRALKGFDIQVQSSDPGDPPKGQVWYNTTAGTLKVAGAGVWSSGGNLTTGRAGLGSGKAGTVSAGLSMGGEPDPGLTEEYNGTAWTAVNSLATTCSAGGSAGTQTAAAFFGGYSPVPSPPPSAIGAVTQEYDGTTWTNVNNMTRGITDAGSGGTQTSAMMVGGWKGTPPSSPPRSTWAITESYDGTSWSAEPDFNLAASTQRAACGTIPAFLAAGGTAPAPAYYTNATEEFDATSWATVNNLATPRSNASLFGIQTAAIIAGNADVLSGAVESYDGTSWASGSSLAIARYAAAEVGSTTAGMVLGGAPDPAKAATEEWNDPGITTITTST